MAGKSVKRARVDAPSSKAGNMPSMMAAEGADQEDVVGKLRMELETATKCIEQLRREKDYEVRQVREEEQNRSSTALKELESRLKAESRREVERVREAVKSRIEADTTRLAGRYERTVKRLSNDLDRCRNELREEIEKRGMSSTTRGGFEAERSRLLAEVRDLKAAKRRLEEMVESAAEVDKQKTAELKRTQEACKAEVAKVSKEANAEMRKLLEELKAKDHQLALLDRNQYPDRGASLQKHQPVAVESRIIESESVALKPVKPAPAGEVVINESKNTDSEKISELSKVIENLKNQLAASEADKTSANVRLDELRRELEKSNETIAELKKSNSESNTKYDIVVAKPQPKAVRFLLPGLTSPVLAREIDFTYDMIDDDGESICSEMSNSSLSSASSRMSPDTTVLYDENIEKNYHLLLTEHLNLQRTIAQLLSTLTATKTSAAETSSTIQSPLMIADADNQNSPCHRKDCIVEKDSLRTALESLKQKHAQFEQNVYNLQQQLAEQREQNEDLEFRVFELEDCAEKCKLTHTTNAAEDLLEKTLSLENEMAAIKERLTYYKTVEDEVCQWSTLGLRECVAMIKRQLNEADNQSALSRLEIYALRKQLEEVNKCQLEVSTGSAEKDIRVTCLENVDSKAVSNTKDMIFDMEDLSMSAMNCSVSTTSGFDDDHSCASSVADLRLEEMPSEETWGFDEEESCIDRLIGSSEMCSTVMRNPTISVQKSNVEPLRFVRESDSEDQGRRRTSLELSPTDTVRRSDDEVWLQRIEKLEARLAQAILSEQRARDQMVLLGEEKDRRIAALQEQVDTLEANEFRLSETVQSLERMERTFNLHVRTSTDTRTNSTSSSRSSKCSTDVDEECDKNTDASVFSPTEPENTHFRYENASGMGYIPGQESGIDSISENRIHHQASEMLRVSLEKLRQAETESDAIDKRIKELSDAISEMNIPDETNGSADSPVETTNSWNVSTEAVDFESEYRQLEILIKELKKVLLGDSESCDGIDIMSQDLECENILNNSKTSLATDFGHGHWATNNVSYSLPASPVFEIQSPTISIMMERSREFQFIERHLNQQIKSLEQDRDGLREAVNEGDAALRELGIQLVELQASEQSLKDEVNRLRTKEDWMISRNNELMELVGRLEESVKGHRTSETELRSRCERHCASETELARELENVRDELRIVEARHRRWVMQLEDEKQQLQSLVDELMEKNCDLEGREAGLLCRIRKLEAVEFGLRSDVAELERSLNEVVDDREKLLIQVSSKESVESVSPAVTSVECSTQCDDCGSESEERCRRLGDRAEFFKEMLEFTEQSYAALQIRFNERTMAETTLRATVAEYEATEKTWAERTALLEADNKCMAKRIAELEEAVKNSKGVTDAFRGIMLLNNIADELDDAEMVNWATVENTQAVGDIITESDLKSPLWSEIENSMGLNLIEAQSDESERKTQKSDDVHQMPMHSLPPPLPQLPPPLSPSRGRRTTDSSHQTNGFIDEMPNHRTAPQVIHTRSQSADIFALGEATPSDDPRWRRASSESRENEIKTQSTFINKDGNENRTRTDQSEQVSASRDPVMERISRSRDFWSSRSLSVPSNQTLSKDVHQGLHGSSNGRPSLIPRIAPSLRAPLVQRAVSEYNGPKVVMPVIKSTPSPHLSPRMSETEQDDRKSNKSFIPRPINEPRMSGSDGECCDYTPEIKSMVVKARPAHQETSKIYTTVLGPNRYTSSKPSHVSGSPLIPQAARFNVTDSKLNLTSSLSSATAANQLRRPVVSSTAVSSEVPPLPGSRA